MRGEIEMKIKKALHKIIYPPNYRNCNSLQYPKNIFYPETIFSGRIN